MLNLTNPFFSGEEKLHTIRDGYHGGVGRVGKDLKLDIYRVSEIFTLLKFIYN